MLRTNSAARISPTEQLYAVNRIKGLGDASSKAATRGGIAYVGMHGLGALDPLSQIAQGAISFITKVAGLFTKDPYRDIHIAAQNATVTAFGNVLTQLQFKYGQNTLTKTDIQNAINAITVTNQSFVNLTNDLARKYPQDASRYMAGQREVSALATQIISDIRTKNATLLNSTSTISDVANSIVSSVTGSGSILPIALLAAGFFFVPKLLSRRG
jgi:hypothetical protein